MKSSGVFVFAIYVRITSLVQAEVYCECERYEGLDAKVNAVIGQGTSFTTRIRKLEEKVKELNNLKDDITALKSQMDKLQKSIHTTGMLRDASEGKDEELSRNVTNMMTTVREGETRLKNLSKEVADFQEERKTLKHDLEKEKRLRRSLEDDIGYLKEELNETKALKEAMDSLQRNVEDLAMPTRNLSGYVDDLLSERVEIRKELATEKELRFAIENKLQLLQMEINETEILKLNLDGLKNKLAELEANVTNENIKEIIEVRFAHLSEIANQTILKQRLDMLEYKFEVQQDGILGDFSINSSINISLNNRVERLENVVLSERNNTEELVELIRDQIFSVNNSVVEISNSVKSVMNESKQLTTRIDDLQYDVRCINESVLTNQLNIEQVLSTKESNHSLLSTDIVLLKESIQKLNNSIEEQILQSQKQNATLRALLDEVVDFYNNLTTEIDEKFLNWKQEINESTIELIANLSGKTESIIKEYINAITVEDLELKEKLETFAVNLEDDLKQNLSLVNFKLKTINQDMAKINKQLIKLQKMEVTINNSASKEDLKHLTEQLVVPISINVSRLNGQMEDVRHQYTSLDSKITEVKDWAVNYVDHQRKMLEKQLKNVEEKIQRDINTTVHSHASSAKREFETLRNKQEEIILHLVNASQSKIVPRSLLETDRPCADLTGIDPNIVITYEDKVYIPKGNSVSDGAELIFRCKHIGRYLLKGHSKIQCENGKWTGNVPRCNKLPDEDDIDMQSTFQNFQCPARSGNYRNPLDCSKYYECKEITKREISCRPNMKFDSRTESCVHPEFSDCDDVPAIDFLPNDTTAITSDGSLVVYPGTDLTLYCISPVNDAGWTARAGDVIKHFRSSFMGNKMIRINFSSVAEKDSGDYICIGNRGKNHTIKIIVRAIECPIIEVKPPLIMSTTVKSSKMILSTKLNFSCEDNYGINGTSLLTCTATGKWSDDVPTCVLKGCLRPNTTNDPWISLTPDVQLYELGTRIRLYCSPGAPAQSIPSSITCGENGKWKHYYYPTFPNCLG